MIVAGTDLEATTIAGHRDTHARHAVIENVTCHRDRGVVLETIGEVDREMIYLEGVAGREIQEKDALDRDLLTTLEGNLPVGDEYLALEEIFWWELSCQDSKVSLKEFLNKFWVRYAIPQEHNS